MTAFAKQLEITKKVLLPIPADTLRPRHQVMLWSTRLDAVKFERRGTATAFTTPAEGGDKLHAQRTRTERFKAHW